MQSDKYIVWAEAGFYINYEEFKLKTPLLTAFLKTGFILTMRNLNPEKLYLDQQIDTVLY